MMPEYLHPSGPEEACNLVRELQSVQFTAGKCISRESEYAIDLREFNELQEVEYGVKTGGKIGAALFFEEWERCSELKDAYPWLYCVIAGYGRDEKQGKQTLGEAVIYGKPEIIDVLKHYHAKIQIQDADHWYRVDVQEFEERGRERRGKQRPDGIRPDNIQPDELITQIILPPATGSQI